MSSKKAKPEMNSEIPQDVASFAQKSVDQAQAAFDKVTEAAHGSVQAFDAAASAAKNRVNDFQLKAIEFTQANLNASFGFARKAFTVKDPMEFFSLQQAFFKDQAEALKVQATELNTLALALAKDAAQPVQDSFGKSFASFSKTFETKTFAA